MVPHEIFSWARQLTKTKVSKLFICILLKEKNGFISIAQSGLFTYLILKKEYLQVKCFEMFGSGDMPTFQICTYTYFPRHFILVLPMYSLVQVTWIPRPAYSPRNRKTLNQWNFTLQRHRLQVQLWKYFLDLNSC